MQYFMSDGLINVKSDKLMKKMFTTSYRSIPLSNSRKSCRLNTIVTHVTQAVVFFPFYLFTFSGGGGVVSFIEVFHFRKQIIFNTGIRLVEVLSNSRC